MVGNMQPKVSVLLPAYHGAAFLDETIQSVLSQTFKDFELIIIDDHSTDNTDEVVKKYLDDSRIVYHKNPQNIGLTGNWNKCLEMARGEYIKFICSDDKFHPQILEKFVPVLDQHPEVSLVGCFKEEFGGKSYLYNIPFHYKQPGKKVILETIKNYNYLGEPTCVMFRKEAIKIVGEFKDYKWITDWEMWVRLLTIGDCFIVPERLCFTRNHPGQVTKSVWLNYTHFFEEYSLFGNIRKGTYNFSFTDRELAGFDYFLNHSRWRIYNTIPDTLRSLHKKRNYKIFRRIISLAREEKYVGTLVRIFAERIFLKFPKISKRMYPNK